jgi:hypothetical protein
MEEPMNDMPSAPIPETGPSSALQVWQKALTKPNEQTFAEIASSPYAKASTAYLWVFIASLIQIFLAALVQNQTLATYANQYGYGDVFANRGFGATMVGAICAAPLGAAVSTLFFALGVAIVQWLARMFGGTGTTDRLAYALASIWAPFAIISGILSLFGAIRYVNLCFSAIVFIVGIYAFVLEVMAVKGVNRISWGAAIGSLLIPFFVVAFLCACLVGGLAALLVPVIRDTAPNIVP